MRRLLRYGEEAVLLECADLADAQAVLAALEDDSWPEVAEIVPGAVTLLLRLRSPLGVYRRQQLRALPAASPDPNRSVALTIAVDYSGEDLDDVAEMLQISPNEVIERHTGQLWTVAFCGFAPGFGYLYGERDDLVVPRRADPRQRVPAGAVGLADRWSGIYPREGPAGWQLIGVTDESLWDLERKPPALLQPGVTVRFVRRGTSPESVEASGHE
jgi:KipI family sensor histidine kinase inhibitor